MSALGFSFISSDETENIEQPAKKRNCTLRKKRNKKSKIDNLLNSLSGSSKEGLAGDDLNRQRNGNIVSDDDNECFRDVADFQPMADLQPVADFQPVSDESSIESPNGSYFADAVTVENFAQLGDVTSSDYLKQYVPNYSQMRGTEEVNTNKDSLMTKLNYMIHLLEEQQDEKTENVTEELVLYLFLGVFVIFIVDSFARAGKYTR
jgi:hypothetical protein